MIFIYFKRLSLFLYIKGLLPNTFNNIIIYSYKPVHFTTLEIQIAFIFSLVEQTFIDFPIVFEDLCFTIIHLIKKFRIVSVGFFRKLLKKSLLQNQVNFELLLVLHYIVSVFCLSLPLIYKYASNMISSVFVQAILKMILTVVICIIS